MNRIDFKVAGATGLAARARLVEAAILVLAGVPATQLRSRSRGRLPVSRARQTAMYLTHVVFGLSFTRIGVCFGRDRTTVRHACALIEERREDPRLELGLGALELALIAMSNRLLPRTVAGGRR